MEALKANRELLNDTAEKLQAKETLSGDELPTVEPFEIEDDRNADTAMVDATAVDSPDR